MKFETRGIQQNVVFIAELINVAINDEKEFDRSKFKPKSTLNCRSKYAAIKIYLLSLEEKLMSIDFARNKCKNLTSEEGSALYGLKNDKTLL